MISENLNGAGDLRDDQVQAKSPHQVTRPQGIKRLIQSHP